MQLQEYIQHFKTTQLWAEMVDTVEDSPWHREANVAVHTEMVMEQFMTRFAPLHSEHEVRIGMIALLFHDVGKPPAEEELPREDGTLYRRYAGHEPLSANEFIQQYTTDEHLRSVISLDEAQAVRWLIEHHLPYGLKNRQKVTDLKKATVSHLAQAGASIELFFSCLRSDAAGRISDDHEEKLQAVEKWIEDFKGFQLPHEQPSVKGDLKTYLMMGPSGSGKSTIAKELCESMGVENAAYLSFDEMKLKFFADRFPQANGDSRSIYDQAWHYCTIGDGSAEFDRHSRQMVVDTYKNAAARGQHVVFSDTVNSTKKRRAIFVQSARQAGFKIFAIDLWVPLEVLVARQKTRGDKSVPASSISSQIRAMSAPWLRSEVDEYVVVLTVKE